MNYTRLNQILAGFTAGMGILLLALQLTTVDPTAAKGELLPFQQEAAKHLQAK